MKPILKILTKAQLIAYFKEVGINLGDVVEVHSSLKSLGYVVGGARTVVEALMDSVGPTGTIVMPLQDRNNTEPSKWRNPPLAVGLYDDVRNNMPAFNPLLSPIDYMGAVVAVFRNFPGVVCSRHPNSAYVAWGANAKYLMANQPMNFSLGMKSPTQKLYALKAKILLIGVDYNCATGLHLGEYLSKQRPIVLDGASVLIDGKPQWIKYFDIELDSEVFLTIGEILEHYQLVSTTIINNSKIRCFDFQKGVKLVANYLSNHKK